MAKYDPLRSHLEAAAREPLTMTFAEIERLVGPLPMSARTYREWWANHVPLLVKGRLQIELSTESFVLENEGDYAEWGPGVGHSWRTEEDSVVITVRWPSVA